MKNNTMICWKCKLKPIRPRKCDICGTVFCYHNHSHMKYANLCRKCTEGWGPIDFLKFYEGNTDNIDCTYFGIGQPFGIPIGICRAGPYISCNSNIKEGTCKMGDITKFTVDLSRFENKDCRYYLDGYCMNLFDEPKCTRSNCPVIKMLIKFWILK